MSTLRSNIANWGATDYTMSFLILVSLVENRAMPVAFGVFGLMALLKRRSLVEIKPFLSWKTPMFWMMALFFLHTVSIVYSDSTASAFNDVGMKMSLLAIPILIVLPKFKLELKDVVILFLLSTLIASFVCYVNAARISLGDPGDNEWYYFKGSYFSFILHRSYFANYLAIGAAISIVYAFKYSKLRWFYVFTAVSNIVTTMLTFSKAGILILIILISIVSYWVATKYMKRIYATGAVVIFVVGVVSIISLSPTLRTRFTQMFDAFGGKSVEAPEGEVESTAARMYMWKTAWEVIRENPVLGVGTSDSNSAMAQKNRQNGHHALADLKLNAHNQYLNTWVQVGILGLISLLMLFGSAIYLGWKSKSLELILFVLGSSISLVFESFFERQQGLMPVLLLITLISTLLVKRRLQGASVRQ